MWKNIVEPYRTDENTMLEQCMLDTHVILTAFPLQQWLQERTLMFRYTYIACLV